MELFLTLTRSNQPNVRASTGTLFVLKHQQTGTSITKELPFLTTALWPATTDGTAPRYPVANQNYYHFNTVHDLHLRAKPEGSWGGSKITFPTVARILEYFFNHGIRLDSSFYDPTAGQFCVTVLYCYSARMTARDVLLLARWPDLDTHPPQSAIKKKKMGF